MDNINEKFELTEEQRKICDQLTDEKKEKYIAYLKWVRSFYPVDEFEICGEDDKKARFYRFNGLNPFDEKEKEHIIYFLKEENPDTRELEIVATVWAFPKRKQFNFLVEWDSRFKGYGTTIYKNAQKILEQMGIEDREEYYITVAHQKDHSYLQYMQAKELVEGVHSEETEENARNLLEKLKKFQYGLSLHDVNSIIEYSKKSGISNEEIVNTLNENGCQIVPSTVNGDDLKKFKEYGLLGIRATSMHQNIMQKKSFATLKLIQDPDKTDFTSEFQKIIEDLKEFAKHEREANRTVPSRLEKFGELVYLMLKFKEPSLIIRNLDDKVKPIVKKSAITALDYVNREWELNRGSEIGRIIDILANSMDLNKDDYINIAIKMLNRNFTIDEYHTFMRQNSYCKRDVIREAKLEMSKNMYFPSPKKEWETEVADKNHKIKRIALPKKFSYGNPNIISDIKDIIINDELATMQIKTDMIGKTKNNKSFVVTNFKDWLFGVPSAPGNLKINKSGTLISLPPQTPQEAVEILRNLIYSKISERSDATVR